MRAIVAMVVSTSLMPMVFLRLAFRQQHLRRAQLVDHVDRLVGQLAVMDVARRQFHRRLDGLVGVFELVIILEIGLEALQDLDRVRRPIGSFTSIFWKRRTSARSFSKYWRYSL